MYKIEDFKTMKAMRYYDSSAKTKSALEKKAAMLANEGDQYIATEKRDGNWGMFIHYSKGNNLIRSRGLSKVTGEYGDYTAKLPHLVEEMDTWPDQTVVLAELCFEDYKTNANDVGSILRCLPPKAIERQKEIKLFAYGFDCLMFNGEDLTKQPYIKRLETYSAMITLNPFNYFKIVNAFADDFEQAASKIIDEGGEGIVIQKKNNTYTPGTRTSWSTLKVKQQMPEMDLLVVDTIEPNKEYEGAFTDKWAYTIEDQLVTKPYFYGWKNGVVVDYNGVLVKVTSGLTDEDREWLASEEAQELIKNKLLYAEISAMMEDSRGSLRHPYLNRLRTDLVE